MAPSGTFWFRKLESEWVKTYVQTWLFVCYYNRNCCVVIIIVIHMLYSSWIISISL